MKKLFALVLIVCMLSVAAFAEVSEVTFTDVDEHKWYAEDISVAYGHGLLAGTDENVIYNMIDELLTSDEIYKQMAEAKNPYGDGFASKRIADAIIEKFSK